MGAAPGDRLITAGRVGRPHGLDGSFHVREARAELLAVGTPVTVAGLVRRIVRRAGTAERPIVRLDGCVDRDSARALSGSELLVTTRDAPALGPDEWWAHELEGCAVRAGVRELGRVERLIALPSCEALEVRDERGQTLLVPLVRDAILAVDVAARTIEVDDRFLGV